MAKTKYTQEESIFRASLTNEGDVGAVSIRKQKAPTDKKTGAIAKDDNGNDVVTYSIEFAERKENDGEINMLEFANAGVPLFRRGKGLRVTWFTCGAEFASTIFGVNKSSLEALPVHSNENQTRVFIGKLNPSCTMNGQKKLFKLQTVAKFASNLDPIKEEYDIKHLLGTQGQNATAKREGAGGDWIMGLNPTTNQPDYIVERVQVQLSTEHTNVETGEITVTNDKAWKHITIERYRTPEVSNAIIPQLEDAFSGGISPL